MAYPVVNPEKGVSRQVLTESPEIMLVRVQFEKGARGAPHQHPHLQSTFVREGRFQFTVGDNTFEVKEGDAFVIPGNTVHGCMALEDGVLIDCFTPRRDDFL